MFKYNEQKYKIGTQNSYQDGVVVISPYAKLRDLILKQPEFIKKQNYVARKKNNNYSMYATPYRKNKDD